MGPLLRPDATRLVSARRPTGADVRLELERVTPVDRRAAVCRMHRQPCALGKAPLLGFGVHCRSASVLVMSKKTKKRKARLRRSKANHGKRPNMGRG